MFVFMCDIEYLQLWDACVNTHHIVIVVCRVEAIYEPVNESPSSNVTMTTSPAYEGVKIT